MSLHQSVTRCQSMSTEASVQPPREVLAKEIHQHYITFRSCFCRMWLLEFDSSSSLYYFCKQTSVLTWLETQREPPFQIPVDLALTVATECSDKFTESVHPVNNLSPWLWDDEGRKRKWIHLFFSPFCSDSSRTLWTVRRVTTPYPTSLLLTVSVPVVLSASYCWYYSAAAVHPQTDILSTSFSTYL